MNNQTYLCAQGSPMYVKEHNVFNNCRKAVKRFRFSGLKLDFLIQCNMIFKPTYSKKVGQITLKVGVSRTFYDQSRTFSIFLQIVGQTAQK